MRDALGNQGEGDNADAESAGWRTMSTRAVSGGSAPNSPSCSAPTRVSFQARPGFPRAAIRMKEQSTSSKPSWSILSTYAPVAPVRASFQDSMAVVSQPVPGMSALCDSSRRPATGSPSGEVTRPATEVETGQKSPPHSPREQSACNGDSDEHESTDEERTAHTIEYLPARTPDQRAAGAKIVSIEANYIPGAIAVGLGATLVMDLWNLFLKRAFSIPSLNYCLLGAGFATGLPDQPCCLRCSTALAPWCSRSSSCSRRSVSALLRRERPNQRRLG